MSGWSIRRLPNALRWAACQVALATPQRIPAALPMTQSRRVWPTISMIVGTPRPGSPTSCAQAPCSSISLDALERLPSLSFRRWRCKALRVPSGRTRGSAKQPMPSSVCASTRNRSHIGAEQNHLWPVSSNSSPGPPAPPLIARAIVVFARTSEPPCFSVIAIPHSALRLAPAGAPACRSGSYVVAVSRGSHSAAISGCARSAGTAANVIVIGQAKPPSAWAAVRYSAVRAAWAAGCADVHGSECSSWRTARSMRSCHARWNSTSSMRWP